MVKQLSEYGVEEGDTLRVSPCRTEVYLVRPMPSELGEAVYGIHRECFFALPAAEPAPVSEPAEAALGSDTLHELLEAIRPFWSLLLALRSNQDSDFGHFLYEPRPEALTVEGWSLADHASTAGEQMIRVLNELDKRDSPGDLSDLVSDAAWEWSGLAMEVILPCQWYWGGARDSVKERAAFSAIISVADRVDRAYRGYHKRVQDLRGGE